MDHIRCVQCQDGHRESGVPLAAFPASPSMCAPLNCEGCGDTFIDARGNCIWPSCPTHGHLRNLIGKRNDA